MPVGLRSEPPGAPQRALILDIKAHNVPADVSMPSVNVIGSSSTFHYVKCEGYLIWPWMLP